MQLRSGRSTTSITKAIPAPFENKKFFKKADQQLTSRNIFAAKMKECLTIHELPENQNFIGDINFFGQTFELILEHFDNLKSYDFTGRLIPTIKGRIAHWRTELPSKLLNRVLTNSIEDVEKTFEAIRKSNAVVEAVAKKFESLGKA